MKIGIDGRLLTKPVTGIGRYKSQLISEMLKQGAELRIYCPSIPTADIFSLIPRNVFRYANFRTKLGRLYWSQVSLPQWAVQDKVDIFWSPTHRLPSLLARKIPAVVTIHDLVWKHASETMRWQNYWLDRLLMPLAIRRADRVIAVSNSTSSDIIKEWPHATKKVRTIYPGITQLPPPKSFESLKKFKIGRPYFLFVGTLEPRKNLETLLRAYSALDLVQRRQFSLVIAGAKGWGKVNVEDTVKKLNLQKDVVITGYISEQDLSTLYAHARFLAMPSLYEGFGFPIIEAMSLGVPVLTSSSSSMPEVAGDAAIVVDPYDIDSISNGIVSLLFDNDLHARLTDKTRSNANRFTWRTSAEEMSEAFLEIRDLHILSRLD